MGSQTLLRAAVIEEMGMWIKLFNCVALHEGRALLGPPTCASTYMRISRRYTTFVVLRSFGNGPSWHPGDVPRSWKGFDVPI